MSTKYDINSKKRYAPTGYEGDSNTDYVISSCGVEDLDLAMFRLFDKQIPIYYDLHGEVKKVPVIFATGERFALLRRKRPIVDRGGALILPLISITRSSLENIPSKGIANNQMFPHVVTKRISEKDLAHRQAKNYEQLKNVDGEDLALEPDISLKPQLDRNIIETIEIPPIKYFGAVYEVSIWSSFTQQMNNILEVIMNAYTLNPGQQFRLESDKGYTFSAFVDGSISQDTNYADFTDAERYIKYNMSINATGYIIAPNILGGKTALRSFVSAPQVTFDIVDEYAEIEPNIAGVVDPDPDLHVFDDLATESSYAAAQGIGINKQKNRDSLLSEDSSKGLASDIDLEKYRDTTIGEINTNISKQKRTWVRNPQGNLVPVMAKSGGGKGETIYGSNLEEVLFNVSTSKE
tara:strand:- start:10 stop:1230 length:1221 start_codon:yes stop_codon:yes gene_type:complete